LRVSLTLVLAVAAMTVVASGFSAAAPSRSDVDAAEERLLALERDFELVVERYNAVHEELTQIQADIVADEVLVSKIEKRMSVNEAAAKVVAEELYKGGSTGALEVVFASDTLADVDAGLQYLRSSEDAQAQVFERLAVDRQLLNERIARLERRREEAMAAQERLSDLRNEIEAKVEDQRSEIEELNALIERAERRRRQRAVEAAEQAAAVQPSQAVPPAAAPTPPAPAASSQAGIAVKAALSQVGKPYQWGAAGPDAYDCSGLTMWAWAQAGMSLPHSSAAQYAATPTVSQGDWQPGDLLFYGSPIHHVALYIGGGQTVEAPYTGATVRIASAARSDYVGAGRPGV
jgi:cell wall-associated NlpC family hydrolase